MFLRLPSRRSAYLNWCCDQRPPRMLISSLVQYNSASHALSTSVRLNWEQWAVAISTLLPAADCQLEQRLIAALMEDSIMRRFMAA
jgi:hypothetical protein